MNLTNEVNIKEKIEAEKLWNEDNFSESAKMYLKAAIYAKQKFNDVSLSKKLLVQYHLADILVPGNFSSSKINNLLAAIDELIINGQDDRFEKKFEPYKDFFLIIINYENENEKKLETQKLLLTEKVNNYTSTEFETLNLILIEVVLANQEFKKGNGNSKTILKLSNRLTDIINISNLSHEFKRKIKEFAIKINSSNNLEYDEKKK